MRLVTIFHTILFFAFSLFDNSTSFYQTVIVFRTDMRIFGFCRFSEKDIL